MHKTGPGLLGALVLGLILSPLATAADQTQSGTAEPAAQSSSDAGSAAQSPSAQSQATPNATDNTPPQPPATGQNSAPAAATPKTPSTAAPAQPSPPANAVPAPADNTSPVPPPAPTDTAPAQPSAPANAVPAQPPAPANNSPAPAKPAPAKPAPVKKATGDKSNAAKTTAAEQAKTAAKNPPVQTFAVAPCPDLNATQVAELIQQDYTQNRFPRFADDKQALGDTMVAWINPEEVTGTGDSWQAPLKIRGQTADRSYGVTLDCQKGVISYTLSK